MSEFHPIDILLVEDDEGHVILIQDNLRRFGVVNKIHSVLDGQEALDFLFHRDPYRDAGKWPTPGLILLDLKLPKVGGFEVLQKLKQDKRLKSIPVIVLTSTGNQHEINRCYELGANNYIMKPVEYSELQEKIRALGLFLEIVSYPEVM